MSGDLLQTKLYIPQRPIGRLRPFLIPRPHLIKKLNQGIQQGCKLTLISAPAGFGKTTLIVEWGMQNAESTTPHSPFRTPHLCWLSLDEGDNDLTRFLTYFVAALQTIKSNIGNGVLTALQSPGTVNIESILTALLNEITEFSDDVVFILDDYHVIESQPIDKALTFLLDHLPPQMHLVITSRIDPSLPLSRLRARRQMTEIRAHDLRFTVEETAVFLNQMMGFDLSAQEIAALELHTEGWIAGLQLAALSMKNLKGSKEIIDFIDNFTGSDRYIQDYLADEVLQQQSQATKDFLLQTSILNRLSGSLCDAVRFDSTETPSSSKGTAVTGQNDGQTILESLEAANLFIVPLDNERRWYRYHHLFADLLRQRLHENEPDHILELHRRASEWYVQKDMPSDAIRHALAAEDFERVADLVEMVWQDMDNSFQSAAWLGWVKTLPDEMIRNRPVLSTQYAWALMNGGEMELAEARLQDAERWLNPTGDMSEQNRRMVVVDEEQFQSLPATIANARSYHTQALGDISGSVEYAELALKLTPEEDLIGRAQATVSLGFTQWASGDLEAAHRGMADWINSMQKAGNIVFAVASAFALADIMVAQGRLHEAARTYKRSLQLASEHDKHVQRVISHLYLGLAMLHHEMGDREAAAQFLQKSEELGKQNTLIDWPYRYCLAQAQLKEAEGDLEAALDLLDEAKRVYARNPVPNVRPVEALKARVYVRQGRLTNALDWVHDRGLSVDDDLSYLHEFEHIVLVRVLIAEYKNNHAERAVLQAAGLLERLLKAAEEGKRMGSVIEILALQALAHQAQGNPLALASLERALTLAEPEGYVRLFVDEGVPMAHLLSETAVHGIMPDYTGKLLAAFPVAEPEQTDPSKTQSEIRNMKSEIVEPLSQRELEVLRLIAQGLSNREISERLFVALNTVKGHNRNIFGKLLVQRRTEAVAIARELGVL